MLIVRSVREIDPGDVETRLHEAAQRTTRRARGAQRTDYFCSAVTQDGNFEGIVRTGTDIAKLPA